MKKAALQNCQKNCTTVWPVGHLLIESFHGSLKIELVLTNAPGTSGWHVLPSPDQARSGARALIIDESADETLFCYRVKPCFRVMSGWPVSANHLEFPKNAIWEAETGYDQKMSIVNSHFIYWDREKWFFVSTLLTTQVHFLHPLLLDASLCECC